MPEPVEFSLIIPAHNEESVIARCLKTALSGAPDPPGFEIIVAANGCSDRTAEIARNVMPAAQILEIPEGSKTGAINVANRAASHFPRIYLDADVECEYGSLAALARTLKGPEIMTAAPAIRLDLEHCNALVKAYYSAWMQQPFAKAGKGGAGCYGLSQAALEAVGEFPQIIGDDIWIHTRFPDEQKRMVAQDELGRPVFSIVRPPRTAWQQIKVEARRMIGNAEVKRNYPSPYVSLANKGGGVLGSLRSGASPIDLLVFYAIKMMVRIETRLAKSRGSGVEWTRDLTSRQDG
ncbi:glycosyltransferase [Qipengyuania sp. ASV99]|uniref:glycosyltransferase n=1 Tax=Qipengyuania sp. ASV99 TaxID=3399681 RepID=UPI003A4C6269